MQVVGSRTAGEGQTAGRTEDLKRPAGFTAPRGEPVYGLSPDCHLHATGFITLV
jgi:hypothetical protein